MELDLEKVDRCVLALLSLGLHDDGRAWKGFDWDSLDRLYQQGLIANPRGRAKSVQMTIAGEARSRQLLEELFGKH